MLPNGRRIENDACCPIGRRLETDACYQMGFRIETNSLYPNQIYSNIFLEVDLKILVFPTIFVSLCFETRTLWTVWCFVQWVYHHVGHDDTWGVLHMMFQLLGLAYLAGLILYSIETSVPGLRVITPPSSMVSVGRAVRIRFRSRRGNMWAFRISLRTEKI
jgi:hypothetical protein